jgi:hypothetical protein
MDELADLVHEMETLATHLLHLDMEIEADTIALVLKALVNGETALAIIDDYGLEDGDGA